MSIDLITLTDPRSPVSEAYRTLRTTLEFSGLEQPLQTVLFTAPSPDEDTATTVVNLAITVAQTGRTVIVVDADLRRPQVHTLLGVNETPGLTEMVRAEAPFDEPVWQGTDIANLFVLTSGSSPASPADVLDSKGMDAIWQGLRERFDMVLINTPPVLAVTDAAILASRVDGVLLVLRAGHTKREHARRAQERLQRVQAPVLGAVLLDAPYDGSVQAY